MNLLTLVTTPQTFTVQDGDFLLLVDATEAFGQRGGLPVEDAEAICPVIERLYPLFAKENSGEVYDCHPKRETGHIGFVTNYPGAVAGETFLTVESISSWSESENGIAPDSPFTLSELRDYLSSSRDGGQMVWPVHAEDGTDEIDRFEPIKILDMAFEIAKGEDPKCDSYSGAKDALGRDTGLIEKLRERGVKRVFLVGIAFDFCIGWTAFDLAEAGFEVYVVLDATRAVGVKTDAFDSVQTMQSRLIAVGVHLITSEQIVAAA